MEFNLGIHLFPVLLLPPMILKSNNPVRSASRSTQDYIDLGYNSETVDLL